MISEDELPDYTVFHMDRRYNSINPLSSTRGTTVSLAPARRSQRFSNDPQMDVQRIAMATSDTPRRRQRRRLTGSQGRASQTRHNFAKLKRFPFMPVDVILEICWLLGPTDLLALSTINKDLRSILLNKSLSLTIWDNALQTSESIPRRPKGMSGPAWAHLLFGPYCHFCGTPTSEILWLFRQRICQRCADHHLLQFIPSRTEETPSLSNADGVSLVSLVPHYGDRGGIFCLKKDYQQADEEFSQLHSVDERTSYIKLRQEMLKERTVHTNLSERWEHSQARKRSEERFQIRQERVNAIITKLDELGWRDEIEGIRPPDSFYRHNSVNRLQELTDDNWTRIKPNLIMFMEKMKAKRLARERNGLVMKVVRDFKIVNHPGAHGFPEPPDYCNFPAVRSIVHSSADVAVDASSFSDVVYSFPALVADWCKGVDARLKGVLKKHLSLENTSGKRTPSDKFISTKLKLAVTVFECKPCRKELEHHYYSCYRREKAQSKPLFYPHVVGHVPCLTRHQSKTSRLLHHCGMLGLDEEYLNDNPSTYLVHDPRERKKWSAERLQYSSYMSSKAKNVVEAVSLDPAVATSEDMDEQNVRLICGSCYLDQKRKAGGSSKSPRNVQVELFEWRTMVQHLSDKHVDKVPLLVLRGDKMRRAVLQAEEELVHMFIPQWACVHCIDRSTEKGKLYGHLDLKDHLEDKHDVQSFILNRDYYLHYSAPNIRAHYSPGKLELRAPAAEAPVVKVEHS